MEGFIELDCLTGPALVRLERVMIVRPDPSGAARTLIVLEGRHEIIVLKAADEMVKRLSA